MGDCPAPRFGRIRCAVSEIWCGNLREDVKSVHNHMHGLRLDIRAKSFLVTTVHVCDTCVSLAAAGGNNTAGTSI